MVPAIRNILGGFLFSGDDVYKKAGVLSGGERTRLAVARMLLRPSNTLLLDEPTNHLDLDSKDVLLDALEDYGGTLIIVSHDRYFVEKLATKIIEIGHGSATGLSRHLLRVPVEQGARHGNARCWQLELKAPSRSPNRKAASLKPASRQPARTAEPSAGCAGASPRTKSRRPGAADRRPTTAMTASGSRPSARRSSARRRRCRSASPSSRRGSPIARSR